MRTSDKEVCHSIFFTSGHTSTPFPTTILGAIGGKRHAFDIARVGGCHDHLFAWNQIFHILIKVGIINRGTTFFGELGLDLFQFFTNYGINFFFAGQNGEVALDGSGEFTHFGVDFVTFKPRQTTEFQFQNGLGLGFRHHINAIFNLAIRFINEFDQGRHILGKPTFFHQVFFGNTWVWRGLNHFNHFIQIGNSESQPHQDMSTISGFIEFKDGTSAHHFFTELQESGDDLL